MNYFKKLGNTVEKYCVDFDVEKLKKSKKK